MQIEVTEKEAHMVYSNRYMEKHGGDKFLFLKIIPIVVAALIMSFLAMRYTNEWLAIVALIAVVSPAIYLAIRLTHNSCKWYRSVLVGGCGRI